MARSRIATGLEKLMSDLPKLMIQRSLTQDAQMKKLSIAATEGYLKEAAKNFYDYLLKLDNSKCKGIAVAPIPNHKLGKTINDRLTRASANK